MFDWNDEEITNIIWGEGGENDDHIVPYPNGSEEKCSGLYEDQTRKQWNERGAEGVNPNEPKPVSRTDSMGTESPKNLTEIFKNAETALLDNCSEVFKNPPESEQGDIADYDWANVGSFDDLDRIFSNDDPIFGHADKLWSSSNDVTESPEKSIPISFDSPFEMNNITSNTPQATTEYSGGKSKALQKEMVNGDVPVFNSQPNAANLAMPDEVSNKGNRRKRMLKTRVKSEEKTEVRELRDICGIWSTPAQYAPTIGQPCSPFLMSQQRPLFPSPFLASPMYATMAIQYPPPPMAILSQFHSSETNPQNLTPGYGNSDHASVKPLTMSPREKIEKLRRRQQMRAMLAIQKQQRQFNNHVEHDNSNKVCIPSDDLSMEDSILYQLQGIIGKLDHGIRLCIRDSLFRLAQSSSQRKYESDTSGMNSGSSDDVLKKEESNSLNRFGKMGDVETETNPIDRTVAHLLFHRPGKHPGKPESPSSAKLYREGGSMGLSTTLPPQSSDKNQMLLSHDQSKSSLCLDTSGNASKQEAPVLGFEASN